MKVTKKMWCSECERHYTVHNRRIMCEVCGEKMTKHRTKKLSLEQSTTVKDLVSVVAPEEKLMLEEMANAVFAKKAVPTCFAHKCAFQGKVRCLQCSMHYCEAHMARESSSGEVCQLCHKPMPRWFARIVQELMKK